jgi:1-acyl-sn-glycerol-3-phosphate acyltransferase
VSFSFVTDYNAHVTVDRNDMKPVESILSRVARVVIKVAVGFYFRRIETFHAGRAPKLHPAIFAANHPCSLTDAFIVGTAVPRKVSIVATAQLFRLKPVAWLLRQVGVIPLNRLKDDPRAMKSVFATFEACFKVLEAGGAIIIFPEGITHDDPQLKTIKSGAARMALELEHRHAGKLGLQVVPVGLTFSSKESYRSEVLVQFGEPIPASEFIGTYETQRKESINNLNKLIEKRIQSLILHLPELELARLVEAVKRLYLDKLRVANRTVGQAVTPQAEELALTQAIAAAIQRAQREQPDRVNAFIQKLNRYETDLRRLNLSDETIQLIAHQKNFAARAAWLSVLAILLAPIALYGWLHRILPITGVNWARRHKTMPQSRKAQAATVSIISGAIFFTIFYALCIAVVHHFFGWPISLWYGLSLPVTGLIAHYYEKEARRLAAALRATIVLLRAPFAGKRLLARRSELIAEIDAYRSETQRAPSSV